MRETASRLGIVATFALASYACSAPEPSSLSYCAPGRTEGNAKAVADAGAIASGNAAPAWPSAGVADAGVGSGGGVAVVDAGAATPAAFLGDKAPFASKPIARSARERHAAAGEIVQQPETNCQTCHTVGGAAVPFLAAGFVANAPRSTVGAADVEVRIWSSASRAGASNHTDEDGFFWIKPLATPLAPPFRAGVRDATSSKLMPPDAPGGACSGASCHGGALGSVFL